MMLIYKYIARQFRKPTGFGRKISTFMMHGLVKKLFLYIVVSLVVTNLFAQNFALERAANDIKDGSIRYDPSYFRINYPMGDVPADRGVCTDVIIRAYRKTGIDLQKEVHEDMKANFDKYPKNWGLKTPDTNIDHRRVPNLMTFFSRHGEVLKNTNNHKDYKPGHIVCWDLGGGILHIGIVVDKDNPMIIHNIGYGQVLEDCLFHWKIIGHYRYLGKGTED